MAANVTSHPPDETISDSSMRRTLFVRNLPVRLKEHKIVDLLKYFGACSVRYMGVKGHLKYCAFARFDNSQKASCALHELHQKSILGTTLRVEYARERHEKYFPTDLPSHPVCKKPVVSGKSAKTAAEKLPPPKTTINYASETWDIPYLPNPNLFYSYPLPTASTLTNISHCLASVPKFYVQVLHLMNKMNLPAPFGEVMTEPPPLAQGNIVEEMEVSESSTESELESDEDKQAQQGPALMAKKNKYSAKFSKKSLKRKVAGVVTPAVKKGIDAQPVNVSDVFEVITDQPASISLNVPDSLPSRSADISRAASSSDLAAEKMSGFGIIEVSTKPIEPVEHQDETISQSVTSQATPYITARELAVGRLPSDELQSHPIFKSYKPGEPTCRLYIKNLAKQVTEKELKYIFGRYVDWSDEEQASTFHIRHMKEGRMKGQAFVTLPHIEAASAAVRECHTYQLHSKPMSLSFAKNT